MAQISPLNLVRHHSFNAAKPISIPLNLSFQFTVPPRKFALAPLFLTSKQSRTRLFVVAEETAVSTQQTGGAAQQTGDSEPVDMRKLFVGNLRYCITSDELRQIFEQHGAVEEAEVVYEKRYKKSRGFAFVTMKTIKDAEAAIEKLNGVEIQKFKLEVNITKRPLSAEDERRTSMEFIDSPYKVFVENLGKKVNARKLKMHFAERGNVLSARVPVNPRTLRCAGFGYVTFSTEEDRDTAIKSCYNTPLMGVKIRVTKI